MKVEYNDWVLDSNEELYFCYWLEALQAIGYVESFTRIQDPILLFDKLYFNFKVDLKPIEKFILHPLEYTPDFIIKWSKDADGILAARRNGEYSKDSFIGCLFYTEDDLVSIVDVKGTFKGTGLTSSITFPIIQKILAYQGQYVQKVIPFGKKGLFEKTFTPKEYLFTPTGKLKKINWEVKTLETYINNKS